VRQIQAKLSRLKADLDQAGVPAEDSKALDAKLETLAAKVASGPPPSRRARHVDAAALAVQVTGDALGNLTAASTRLGRAFGLGYDLANTCMLPKGATDGDLARRLGTRVVELQEALADLASSLPEHAGRAVSLSLAQWEHWAADPKLSKSPVNWPQEGIEEALDRQGQVWRSVLSGDKLGKDMLDADDYIGALKALALPFLKRWWTWALLGLFFAMIGLGAYLLVTHKHTVSTVIGAVLSGLGVVGITSASLRSAFSDVAKEIETQVWGAELDYAIADAVTVPPGDWRVTLRKIDVPPARGLDPHIAANSRTVHRVSHAIRRRRSKLRKRWQVQKYLDEKGTYETLAGILQADRGSGMRRRMKIAKGLIDHNALGCEPQRVAAGAPGRIVSRHEDAARHRVSAFVWTFRHGRVHHIKQYDDYDVARAAARLPYDAKETGPMPDIDTVPIRYATDRRKLRQAEAEVRKRLSPEHRKVARQLTSWSNLLALRARRGKGSPDVFMPRDPYLGLVQNALERRMKCLQPSDPPAAEPDDRQAADGTSLDLGDQLFSRFGPDDFGWMSTLVEAGLTALKGDKHEFGKTPTEYELPERARFVLLADWGTGTPRALEIADKARQRLEAAGDRDCHLIHLGDVYYCGLPDEYRSRFLDCWPARVEDGSKPSVKSWNLNGNHDMFSGGGGYFEAISRPPFAQQAGTSCFRLWNDHWQFIALDTAYADNDLHDEQLPWLEKWVEDVTGSGEPRRTVLLSHHQLGSAHAEKSVGAGIRDKTANVRSNHGIHAWLWGHEHEVFIYKPYMGVECPVCLGNGGVPTLLSHRLTLAGAFDAVTNLVTDIAGWFKTTPPPPEIGYQPTVPDVDTQGLKWAKLGFVVIDIDGDDGKAWYVDEDNNEHRIDGFTPKSGAEKCTPSTGARRPRAPAVR
jgi:3',5'-cyclic AMP phosphodiesterase CpdA